MATETQAMPFYKKVAFGGLGLFWLAAILFAIAITIEGVWGEEGVVVFFVILVGISLLIAFLLSRKPAWSYAFGILGGIIGLIFFSESADLFLTTPAAFFDFFGTLILLLGMLILAGASIVGLLQHRSGNPRTEATSTERTAILAVGGVLAVLAVVSIVLTVANMGDVSAEERQGAIEVQMKKTEFEPHEIRASAGQVRVVVKNFDPFLHTFTLDDANVDVRVTPRQEKVIDLGNLSAGSYVFRCEVPGHEDMVGTLVVR